MKKHLRLILLAIISMIVPLAVSAQEDVTGTYVLNPSFEEGPSFFHNASVVINGWNVSATNLNAAFLNQNDGGTPPDGANVFGVWAPNTIGDFEVSQTVKNLPVGTYEISCVLTVPTGGYSTQRFFASTPSQGTKASYFGTSATSLAVVPGETYTYANYAIDGNGNGPFHPMGLKIKVEAGDSLVFGIRSNGKLSTICPFSALTGHGLFKVDNFKLSFIADENAFTRALVQKNLDLIKLVPLDSIPGGYADLIQAKVTEAENVIANVNVLETLLAYNDNLIAFTTTLNSGKEKFASLMKILIKTEDTMTKYPMSGKDILQVVFDASYEVFFSNTALNADFDKANTDVTLALEAYSKGRIPENLALIGTPTTSFCSDWESLAAVNDGFEPINSADRTYPVYGNWTGTNGTENWVQYEWPFYHTITAVSVYWFADGGGLLQPNYTNVEYMKNNAWVSVGRIDTVLDQFNTLVLDSIKTNKIRIRFSSATTTGISEFRVIGLKKTENDIDDYKRMVTDELALVTAIQDSVPKGYSTPIATIKQQGTTLLGSGTLETLSAYYPQLNDYRKLLDSANVIYDDYSALLKTAKSWLDTTSFAGKAALQAAYEAAGVVFAAPSSLIDDFNNAYPVLDNAIHAYTGGVVLVNLAMIKNVVVTTSHVSPWENLKAVNDGFEPANSGDKAHLEYGNWTGTDAMTHWVQYDFPTVEPVKSISVYWFVSGDGGVIVPDSAGIDYYNGTEWLTAGLIGGNADEFNNLNVDIMASKVRVTMRSTTATGIIEFAVRGYETPVSIAPVKQINSIDVYPTMVKRGSMMTIDFGKALAKPVSVEMFMMSGQKVYGTSVTGRTSTVNVPSTLASGIYLMVFDAPEGRLYKKIVVE